MNHFETLWYGRSWLLHRTALHQYWHAAVGQQWPFFSSLIYESGHDRSQCTTTKDRSRKSAVMVALSLLHASEGALRILAKGNWKMESFLCGGRSRFVAWWKMKKEFETGHTCTGARASTHTHTHSQARTHTHTQLKCRGPPGPQR